MPTAQPRHHRTETPTVDHVLDRAASADEVHRTAVLASSGAYADAYDDEFLHELREDWPA